MNMQFTVDCQTDLRDGPSFRLTEDRTWRSLGDDAGIVPGDRVYTDPVAAGTSASSFDTINAGGASFDARHEMGIVLGHTENVAHVSVRVHRTEKPRQFDKEDIRRAIARGDDTKQNVLIVDIEGNVKLLDVEANLDYQQDPRIAAAYSIFQPGNDYVGTAAARDERFINDVYRGLMLDWIDHLRSGEPNCHGEDHPPMTDASLLKRLAEATSKLG
jgi:hypothetical protein